MLSKKAMPLITWFGGACCTPSAFRKSESTTTILTNEVKIITINGKSDIKAIATVWVISDGLDSVVKFVSWLGMGVSLPPVGLGGTGAVVAAVTDEIMQRRTAMRISERSVFLLVEVRLNRLLMCSVSLACQPLLQKRLQGFSSGLLSEH